MGNEGIMRILLDRNADIRSKDSVLGRTPLHLAAKHGRYQVTLQLLRKGVDIVNIGDRYGATALLCAAENGHEAVVKLLLESGADPNRQDDNERTPLMWAIVNEHEPIVRLLLENGAQVDRKDHLGRTAPSLIAMSSHEELMTMLVEKGADINAIDNDGWTSLWSAAMNGNENILQLLIEKGADLEAQDLDGLTPLVWAVMNGHEKMVVLLLRAGADPRFQDEFATALFSACDNESIAKWLKGITHVLGYVETSISQMDPVQLSDVLRKLCQSRDGLALEWLLELLQSSRISLHASTEGRPREQLTRKKVLAGDILDVDTLAISKLLSQLSTTIGRRVQFSNPSKAEEFYHYAAAIYKTVLESFVQDAVNVKQSGNESSAVDRYGDVPKQFYLLKFAAQRLGRWPEDYSIYERLNANPFLHFGEYLADFDGVERWNLKKFGSGRAEADDDLLDLDHMDSVLKLSQIAV